MGWKGEALMVEPRDTGREGGKHEGVKRGKT